MCKWTCYYKDVSELRVSDGVDEFFASFQGEVYEMG